MTRALSCAVLLAAPGCAFDTSGAATALDGGPPPPSDASPTIDASRPRGDCTDAGADELCHWARRRKLRLDLASLPKDLDGVPVLVSLDGGRIDYTVMQANGEDLRFVDADGTLLPHEIESWAPAGVSRVWVRFPRAHALSTTDFFWMYYSNATARDVQDAPGLWTTYELVYHMGANGLVDSTGHGHDGIDFATTIVTGPIAGARRFDRAASAYVDTGYTTNLHEWTVEAWARGDTAPSTAGGVNGLLMREKNYELCWDHIDPAFAGAAALRDGAWYPAPFGLLTGATWYWLAATYDGATLSTFENGVLVATNEGPDGDPDGENVSAKLGRSTGADAASYFAGVLDEVRIDDFPHSADWETLQYRSMTDTLLQYGPEERL